MPPKQQATLKANHLSGGLHAAAVMPRRTIIRLETRSGTSGTWVRVRVRIRVRVRVGG